MKNYVICTSLDEQSIETLKRLKDVVNLSQDQIHIVTIFEIKLYNLDLVPYIYPTPDQYPEIDKSTVSILHSLAESLGVPEKNLTVRCLFDSSREEAIKNYLTDESADMVITATRGKHGIEGFFSSSFTDFLCKFSPCNVLVLRPAKVSA